MSINGREEEGGSSNNNLLLSSNLDVNIENSRIGTRSTYSILPNGRFF